MNRFNDFILRKKTIKECMIYGSEKSKSPSVPTTATITLNLLYQGATTTATISNVPLNAAYSIDVEDYFADNTKEYILESDVGTFDKYILNIGNVAGDMTINVDIEDVEFKDYTEFRNIAYVDTGYQLGSANNNNTIIELDVAFTGSDALFGYNKSNANQVLMGSFNGKAAFRWGVTTITYGENLVVGRYYKMRINTITKEFSVNDTTISAVFGNIVTSNPIALGVFFGSTNPSFPDSGSIDVRSLRINVDGEDVVNIKSANTDGMFDIVSKKYLTNSNTRGTIESKDIVVTEMDYTEFKDYAYINTGYSVDSESVKKTKITSKVIFNNTNNCIHGINEQGRRCYFGVLGGEVCVGYGNNIFRLSGEQVVLGKTYDFNLDIPNRKIYINGVVVSSNFSSDYAGNGVLVVGGYLVNNVQVDTANMSDSKVLEYKIYGADGNLDFDLVPATVDGAVNGMYEKVNGNYFTNAYIEFDSVMGQYVEEGTIESKNYNVVEYDYFKVTSTTPIPLYDINENNYNNIKIEDNVRIDTAANTLIGASGTGVFPYYHGRVNTSLYVKYLAGIRSIPNIDTSTFFDITADLLNKTFNVDGVEHTYTGELDYDPQFTKYYLTEPKGSITGSVASHRYFRLYDNNVLKVDLIGVTVDGIPHLYDKVTGTYTYYPNVECKNFDIVEYNYIKSTAKMVIDPEISIDFTSDYKIETEMGFTNVNAGSWATVGYYPDIANGLRITKGDDNRLYVLLNGKNETTSIFIDDDIHSYIFNNTSYSVDGNTYQTGLATEGLSKVILFGDVRGFGYNDFETANSITYKYYKVYKQNILTNHFVGITADGVPALYDKVTKRIWFNNNLGATNFIDDYEDIKAIKIPQASSIDTGVGVSSRLLQDIRIQARMIFPKTPPSMFNMQGVNIVSQNSVLRFSRFNNQLKLSTGPNLLSDVDGVTLNADTILDIDIDIPNSSVVANGVTKTGLGRVLSTDETIYCNYLIGGYVDTNSGTTNFQPYNEEQVVYSFKIYDRGVLIRDYIPAKRNVDGVVGLFDNTTKTFHTDTNVVEYVEVV